MLGSLRDGSSPDNLLVTFLLLTYSLLCMLLLLAIHFFLGLSQLLVELGSASLHLGKFFHGCFWVFGNIMVG